MARWLSLRFAERLFAALEAAELLVGGLPERAAVFGVPTLFLKSSLSFARKLAAGEDPASAFKAAEQV